MILTRFILVLVVLSMVSCAFEKPIDRYSLVNRHNIEHSDPDIYNSLTVGNGGFAFTVDITGLQTFPEKYETGVPLGTFSDWGWHSFPNTGNYSFADVTRYYQVGDDSIPYFYQFEDGEDNRENRATAWLRESPHRIHLGIIGLELTKSDGSPVSSEDIVNPQQKLNLWTGEISSKFYFDGLPVEVITLCDQEADRVAVNIHSDLIKTGQLAVNFRFSYPRSEKFNSGHDFSRPKDHSTTLRWEEDEKVVFSRELGEIVYHASLQWEGAASINKREDHYFVLRPDKNSNTLTFGALFSEEQSDIMFDFNDVRCTNRQAWSEFWNSGGAVDFSGSKDERAFELERRVILSQYLTKTQCTGPYPPQETGLTYNSWHGKFHLEMHWWHGIHFILWGREDLILQQLEFYYDIKDKAREMAQMQGYEGVRWQKMTDPSGVESPSSIGVFLIWQQPHIIYFADLLYRSMGNDSSVVEKFTPLVMETAEFMASYARYDADRDEYVLGPALIPAQERFAPEITINPAFELAYWHWGLETAQQWREKNGLERNPEWQDVIDKLSPLPMKDGLYLFTESAPDSYSNENYLTDHPMVLGLLGILPETPMVDHDYLNNTLNAILEKWHWDTCWGWDFPMAAMNAAKLGRQNLAVDLLLMETIKNTYLLNGHNYQDDDLSLYLPGNGGLLTAVAMMCTMQNRKTKSGFPDDGTWKVRHEGLKPLH
ncbi:hypothetical protein [Alkalitalea saponilacus]|uniref:Glycosyl hydrolase family 65, N-terminal domain n=1 Tax=Alkalitalea saponilacus TaxID=889453 RepID=A0A1T5B8I0_9BACT|nr:hypothetical protein [Alkalitalea saponilacus]ASB49756.1 hypothetical protein CDL62_11715 [Alkalitalea saponilacus]SKB43552.1 hypothetical protein SAMN03080601_00441 [Alkalitalea saponilacus]